MYAPFYNVLHKRPRQALTGTCILLQPCTNFYPMGPSTTIARVETSSICCCWIHHSGKTTTSSSSSSGNRRGGVVIQELNGRCCVSKQSVVLLLLLLLLLLLSDCGAVLAAIAYTPNHSLQKCALTHTHNTSGRAWASVRALWNAIRPAAIGASGDDRRAGRRAQAGVGVDPRRV